MLYAFSQRPTVMRMGMIIVLLTWSITTISGIRVLRPPLSLRRPLDFSRSSKATLRGYFNHTR